MNARTPTHLGIATAILLAGTAGAQIVNGSFEIADPDYPEDPWFSVPLGWTNPLGYDYYGWRSAWWFGFTPVDGSFMAVVPGGGWLDQEGIWLNAGDRVVFEYGVDNFDSYRAASAMVSLIGHERVDFFGPEVPVGGTLSWTTGEIVAPVSGVYTLRISGDGYGYSPAALFDNVRVVPGPGAAMLLAAGGLTAMRRRRR